MTTKDTEATGDLNTEALPWAKEYGDIEDTTFRPLPFNNVAEMIRDASRQYANHTAFTVVLPTGAAASLTYREVDELSDRFAYYLRNDLGLSAGDRVAVQMPNCLAYPVASFGIFKADCVLVNVNPLYTAREMNHQLKDSGAKVLVVIDMFADKVPQALEGTQVKHVIKTSLTNFFPPLKRVLINTVLKLKKQIPKSDWPTIPFAATLKKQGKVDMQAKPETLAVLQYTGGTTGVAKGAELMHSNLLANIAQIEIMNGDTTKAGEEVVLTALPLYHIFAFTFNMLFFYRSGGHNLLCPSPRPVDNLRPMFENYEVTKFSGVNTLFQGLLNTEWFTSNPPKKLNLTISGGTALHTAVAEKWFQVVGSRILEGYGLSETSPTLCVNPTKGENRPGTIGIPLPGTLVRIVDENDEPVPVGEPGELVAKGPQVMRGYANRPEETAKALKDGWFHTGDIAIMDERGYFRIVDRKKDMIDVSGFNVFPNEVEDALAMHPDIIEAAVIGVPNDSGSETVRAYVSSSNPKLTAEDVIAFARENLTAYKVPKQVIFRDDLPKTPVGKILRKELKEEALSESKNA